MSRVVAISLVILFATPLALATTPNWPTPPPSYHEQGFVRIRVNDIVLARGVEVHSGFRVETNLTGREATWRIESPEGIEMSVEPKLDLNAPSILVQYRLRMTDAFLEQGSRVIVTLTVNETIGGRASFSVSYVDGSPSQGKNGTVAVLPLIEVWGLPPLLDSHGRLPQFPARNTGHVGITNPAATPETFAEVWSSVPNVVSHQVNVTVGANETIELTPPPADHNLNVGNRTVFVYVSRTPQAPTDLAMSPPEPAPETAQLHDAVRSTSISAWATGAMISGAIGLVATGVLLVRRHHPLAIGAFFTRLAPARLLEHPARKRIMQMIEQEPGITTNEAERRMALGHGAFAHHLRKLEESGRVARVGDGQMRRLFVAGAATSPVPPTAERIVAALTAPTRA